MAFTQVGVTCFFAVVMLAGTAQAVVCHKCQHVTADLSGSTLDAALQTSVKNSIEGENNAKCKDGKLIDDTIKTDTCDGQCLWMHAKGKMTFSVGTGTSATAEVDSYMRQCVKTKDMTGGNKDKCVKDDDALKAAATKMNDGDVTFSKLSGEMCFCAGEKCNGGGATIASLAVTVLCLFVAHMWY